MPDMTLVLRFFNYVGEHGAKPIHGAPPALPQSGAATQVDAGDNTALVNLVSKGLRRSLEWSLAWYTYCDYYRDNIMDPMMHERSSLVGFLDYLGLRAMPSLLDKTRREP